MQVLQEFYVNVTRKIPKPLPKSKARAVVDTYAVWCVEPDLSDLSAAFRSRLARWRIRSFVSR